MPYAWRMRVGHEPITFDDGFVGVTTIDLQPIGGDFVVWKSAGTPAYQLAVVVDDAAQGVTEVVRGQGFDSVHAAPATNLPSARPDAAAICSCPFGRGH